MPLSRPEPLGDTHELGDFFCGIALLDDWLKRRARANQVNGATRTYVATENHKVIGYYALASGAIALESAVGRFRRNMPDPIPVAILVRLAVDRAWQGRGLGRALFRDCALRIAQAATRSASAASSCTQSPIRRWPSISRSASIHRPVSQ